MGLLDRIRWEAVIENCNKSGGFRHTAFLKSAGVYTSFDGDFAAVHLSTRMTRIGELRELFQTYICEIRLFAQFAFESFAF